MLSLRHYAIAMLFYILLVSGCMVGPNFHSPPPPKTRGYTSCPLPPRTAATPRTPAGNPQYFVCGQDIPACWWYLFHSPELNKLICMGIANSPNLQAAFATLRQARENLNTEIGNLLYPAIDAQFSAQRIRFSGTQFGVQTTSIFSLYNASVNATYDLDVFGGSRRQIEAAAAQVDYQCYQLQAAYLTLTSNIVTTVITAASLLAQIEANCEIIHTQEAYLNIVKQQYRLGGVSGLVVAAQETQLAQFRALLPPLVKNLEQTRHALAVLVGCFPSEICIPPFYLDELHLPGELPISLPSCLVRQRPDIRAQEALLHAASAQIGVATANLYPQITLAANYGYQGNVLSSLFSGNNVVWSYGVTILQPIFHGGALRAQRRAAIAGFQQACAVYRQTVLQAFQNVADVLKALENDAILLKAQRRAEIAALKTLRITRGQFRLGGVNYLNLLDAERQYQQTRINRIQAQALRFADTAALFQALGGGWWNNCKSTCRNCRS